MKILKENVQYEIISRTVRKNTADSAFHWHENIEIVQVLEKPGSFLVDGKMIEAQPGDIVVIKEQSVHHFMVEDDTLMRIIQFNLKILLKHEIKLKAIKPHIKAAEIDEIPGLREKLDSLFMLMDKEKGAVSASENLFLQYITVSAYILLMQYFSEDEAYSSLKRDRKEFYRITEYVNLHFRENINATIIGKELFISRSYATMLFMKYSGMGLNDYIRSLRIKYANQLLNDGLSVTEAALESGFQCVRTFNNAYKEQMGMTPTEYIRKTMKQKRLKV